jgi:uncharacterized protein (DUF4415 family)
MDGRWAQIGNALDFVKDTREQFSAAREGAKAISGGGGRLGTEETSDPLALKLRFAHRSTPIERDQMTTYRTRRPVDAREAAEKAFKATTKPVESVPEPKGPSIPNAKELVSLRIDQDVLTYFQGDGPGWQDRINAALRKAAGL